MANPIRKLVQLVLDKRAATKMEGDAKKSLSTIDKGFQKLKAAALKLGATLAVAFGVRAMIRFGKESVRIAAESEAIWSRLAKAVENTGTAYQSVEADIKSLARAMQDVTTVGDEDFAQILTELITISNDYEQSLKNVGVVADLAAAKQIDLKTAAQLVGRAMIGETALLKRYGIVVEEGADGVKAMAEAFRGFAMNEATTLQGKLKQLSNEWSDFRQAIGEVMVAGGKGAGIISSLTEVVKDLTVWVETNKTSLVAYGRAVVDTVRQIAGALEWAMGLIDPRVATARDERQRLEDLHTQVQLDAERLRLAQELRKVNERIAELESRGRIGRYFAIGELAELDMQRDAILGAIDQVDRKAESLGQTAESVSDRLKRLFGEAGAVSGAGAGEGAKEEAKQEDKLLALYREHGAALIELNRQENEREERAKRLTEAQAGLNAEMVMSAENAAKIEEAMEGMQAGLQRSQAEMETLGNVAADTAGTIVSGILGGNFGELAAWKAKQNAIMAAEQLAMGLVSSLNPITAPKAAGHFAAAKMFTAIAASWGALAAVTGGGRGGGGGGAAAAPADTGGAAGARTGVPGDEVHIYFVGPGFDAVNPEVQRVVYGAAREAAQRFGENAIIKTHRRPNL